MLTMLQQSLASKALAQQIAEERFEEIQDALCGGHSASLGAPTERPVIDIQIVFLERRCGFMLSGRSGLSGSVHVEGICELHVAELPLEVARERIDPDALDGLSVAVQDVELPTALGIAEMLPVGSLVAGAGKARLLDEGFEQHRPI